MNLQEYTIAFTVAAIIAALLAAGTYFYFYRRPGAKARARVSVTNVYLTAGGSMLDVRYRVTRPGYLLSSPGAVYVIGPDGSRAGQMMNVAKIGRLATRRANRKTGGFLLLRNTSGVTRGDQVTVVISKNQYKSITVQ